MQKHLDIIRPQQKAKKLKLSRKQVITLLVAAVVLLAVVIAVIFVYRANSSSAFIRKDAYQALFLTNNQVYFGKLHRLNDSSYRLTDVYYVKADAATPEGSTDQSASDPTKQAAQAPSLVKLGEELHGPQDEIIIKDSQVLFWENLKADGKVSKAITAYKSKQ